MRTNANMSNSKSFFQIKDQVLALIEKELCGKLGALNATCVQYVESYGKVILYELSQKIDPSVICHNIGLCSMKPVPPHNILKPIVRKCFTKILVRMFLKLTKNLQIKLKASQASLNCTLCKTVFTQIDNLIKSNATQVNIVSWSFVLLLLLLFLYICNN